MINVMVTGACATEVDDPDRPPTAADDAADAADADDGSPSPSDLDIALAATTPAHEVTPMREADACTAIVTTYGLHGLATGCPTTIKTCPGLFRDSFGVACMQYDRASVEDCLDNIEATTTCDEIRTASCAVQPIWGSEPLGCEDPN